MPFQAPPGSLAETMPPANAPASSVLLTRLLAAGKAVQASAAVRLDGWVNTLTGLGDPARDKTQAGAIYPDRLLTVQEMDWLYHFDDMANRICSAVPEDALREGFTVRNDGTDTADGEGEGEGEAEEGQEDIQAGQILARMTELEIPSKVREAMIWARVTGAGGIVLLVDGAGLPEEPLDDSQITGITALMVVDRGDLNPASWYQNLAEPKYGEVETYYVQQQGDTGAFISTNVKIHETRIVMFPGVTTSRRMMRQNSGWRHSALQRIFKILMQSNSAFDSTIAMMQDMSQAVFKMVGLLNAIAEEGGEGEARIQKRITLMDMVRSSIRAIVLDAGDDESPGEDFKVVERSAVTGADALLTKVYMRLSAAARMPFSILMSQAPTGLGDTGATDLRWWYDLVRVCQTFEAKPRLNRLARIVAKSIGIDPDGWTVDFPALWQLTPAEEAEFRSKVAATDAVYITNQVLLPEEVCLARWGKGVYSSDITLSPEDIRVRREILATNIERAEEDALNPPEPMPAPGALPAKGPVPAPVNE